MVESRKRKHESDYNSESRRDSYRNEAGRSTDQWVRRPIEFNGRSTYNRRPAINKPNNRYVPIRRKVDRTKTCPMLIRVYCNVGKHNKPSDFVDKKFPGNELRIYTWKDATLRELMSLVTEVFPESRSLGTCFDFSIVYPNFKSRAYEMKGFGSTCSGQSRADDDISLDLTKFQIGDCLDVAIFPPKQRHPKI